MRSDTKSLIGLFKNGVILSIIGKLLSFLITFFLLYQFGTNRELDIFITTSGFIIMINMIINKAYLNTFPTIYLNLKDNEKNDFMSSLLIFTVSLALAIFVLFFMGSNILIKILAPGFDINELAISSGIIKLLSISLVFNVISSIILAYLKAIDKTDYIYIKEVIVYIVVLFFMAIFKNNDINYISLYYVLAYFFSFVFLCIIFIKNYRLNFSINVNLFIKYSRGFLFIATPILLSSGVNEVKNIIDKVFASYLQDGGISAINFSYRIIGLPVNILGGVLVTVIFTRLIKASKSDVFNYKIMELSTLVATISIPVSFFVFFSSENIASIFSGLNSSISSELLSGTIAAYSFCIFGNAMILLMNTVFYAKGESRKTLVLSFIVTILNIVFNSLLIRSMGAAGLALSTTLASVITYIVSVVLFNKESNSFSKSITVAILKILFLSIPSVIIFYFEFPSIFSIGGLYSEVYKLIIYGVIFVIINSLIFYLSRNVLKRGFKNE